MRSYASGAKEAMGKMGKKLSSMKSKYMAEEHEMHSMQETVNQLKARSAKPYYGSGAMSWTGELANKASYAKTRMAVLTKRLAAQKAHDKKAALDAKKRLSAAQKGREKMEKKLTQKLAMTKTKYHAAMSAEQAAERAEAKREDGRLDKEARMIEETGKLVQVTKKKRKGEHRNHTLRAQVNKLKRKQKEGREKLRAARGEVNQQKKRKTQLKKHFVQ